MPIFDENRVIWSFKLFLILAAVSVGLFALIYSAQTRLIFPTRLAERYQAVLPASAVRLEIETSNGTRLRGVHIPPAFGREGEPVFLGFGGGGGNADRFAEYLHGVFPDSAVVTFHYRGYRPSSGRPSAAALLADAALVHDHLVETLGYRRVVAVGYSIGSAVAAYLAAQRPLAGLILVAPFDSLKAMAREHYPWAPFGWLLLHRIDTAEYLRGATAPTAVIAAANDTIVPPRRTEPVRRAIPNLVFDRTIAGADHNLYRHAAFRMALSEALTHLKSTGNEPMIDEETKADILKRIREEKSDHAPMDAIASPLHYKTESDDRPSEIHMSRSSKDWRFTLSTVSQHLKAQRFARHRR
jgi:pimeloyl-ACP methyl ester carboxylesterase